MTFPPNMAGLALGFTGTRKGLTSAQREALYDWFGTNNEWFEFHHGCCLGADASAADIAYHRNVKGRLVARPCNIPSMTSENAIRLSHVVHDPLPPLDRNKLIVDACDLLLACPGGFKEELRSGTWATIRHARKTDKPRLFFYPDGRVEME